MVRFRARAQRMLGSVRRFGTRVANIFRATAPVAPPAGPVTEEEAVSSALSLVEVHIRPPLASFLLEKAFYDILWYLCPI